jgi:hypothetical protein
MQGAVATALRALAALALRAHGDGDLARRAREALDMLDGRVPYPDNPTWMADTASALRMADSPAAGRARR